MRGARRPVNRKWSPAIVVAILLVLFVGAYALGLVPNPMASPPPKITPAPTPKAAPTSSTDSDSPVPTWTPDPTRTPDPSWLLTPSPAPAPTLASDPTIPDLPLILDIPISPPNDRMSGVWDSFQIEYGQEVGPVTLVYRGEWWNVPGSTRSWANLHFYNVVGGTLTDHPHLYNYRLLAFDPVTLQCSLPRVGAYYIGKAQLDADGWVRNIGTKSIIPDLRGTQISLTRGQNPPLRTTLRRIPNALDYVDPLVGTWESYVVHGQEFGPVDIQVSSSSKGVNMYYVDGPKMREGGQGGLIDVRFRDYMHWFSVNVTNFESSTMIQSGPEKKPLIIGEAVIVNGKAVTIGGFTDLVFFKRVKPVK